MPKKVYFFKSFSISLFLVAGGVEGVGMVAGSVEDGFPLLATGSLFEFLAVLKVYLRFLFYNAGFVDGDAAQVMEDIDGDVVGTHVHRGNMLFGRFAVGALCRETWGVVEEQLFYLIGDGGVVDEYVPVCREAE